MKKNTANEFSISRKAYLAAQGLFLVAFLAVTVAALHPEMRQSLRDAWMSGEDRNVLSTVTGNLAGDGSEMKVIKVQSKTGLFLEVYRTGQEGQPLQMARLRLPEHRDGFVTINGQVSNLLLEDMNGDSILEIVAPSFDADQVAHLNVFRYNAEDKQLVPVQR